MSTPTPAHGVPGAPGRGHASVQRLAQLGLVVNALLAVVKLVAGLLGNAYALVADAIESSIDMVGSLVVWGGLRIASRDPDERYPFGYGRAEAIAGAVVGALMLGAAAGISIEAIAEIRTPHDAPAPWTLGVLVLVIVIKELLAKRVLKASEATGSVAVAADAWHHRADAITSAAAFIGISVALIGGPGWEPADDWAALVAAGVITVNALLLFRTAAHDLMDGAPARTVQEDVAQAALSTDGVLAIEKLKIRKSGMAYYVDIHVQADPTMSLHDAHILSGCVKTAIRARIPSAAGVLIHMEPYEPVHAPAGTRELGTRPAPREGT
ncbi:MAG TPA: cation transporter [Gemmatimonas aurantiaca]|uniref:Cation transporter n=2 Tax=Gemmatimonas aurantiaca TaxID=173480 RepID=A0A3D4V9D8_9BACT|nr:cation diffusion facilitator family transporter [Gemmatimonas aurantiaca]BAH39136.1 putative cation efflux protein [Gemmatimonas aurantiaca T-27]HCT57434.1 cation transporter [Gemmatimonas aurantiaca]